ncbi:peroxiredoxin [Halothiobacillus neapolitanus]|jgi:peroxiredoxin|uniref:Glutathione-dependent peroxiredoxin n=1 Tax=Halothiobacillus neapolitanus (strain ATCC 23641 / DSM 15147 / CIP 104769 / NCIMB 8539 / c2) TaxID=555778 RepID=D0KY33_HALNC|nr:peroxiredoxin [Halothiobacillus neapolitanus]ACX95356.1 Redoxin domain protein [Halothiobacillus neapolitanus c2]OZB75264.1 MAG: peroxiredoxin [Halothiobacillus sp. 14-55-98]TDN58342.1 peroxiredoxin [Halothiobacillus neapolitanus]
MIEVGQKLPEATLYHRGEQGLNGCSVTEMTAAQRIVLFAVPGAFTPTCSDAHVPGFMVLNDAIRAKGIDNIFCVAVNDPFVMKFWGEHLNVGDAIRMISDGNGMFTRALGMERDMSNGAMGIRSKRYAMILNNGVVEWLGVDESGLANSSAEAVLGAL